MNDEFTRRKRDEIRRVENDRCRPGRRLCVHQGGAAGWRLIAIPSRARIGRANVTWLNGSEQRVFEYETIYTLFAVGVSTASPRISMATRSLA